MSGEIRTIKNQNTFLDEFQRSVLENGDKTAVCCEGKSYTYTQLDDKSSRIAAYILNKHRVFEEFIGIFLRRSIDYLACILGVMKSGNIYVPIDPDTLNPGNDLFPEERLRFMLDDTKMPLILTDAELRNYLNFIPCDVTAVEDIFKEVSISKYIPIQPITPSTAAYAIYTSGSTGKPKLTVMEHHSLANLYRGLNKHIFSKICDTDLQIQTSINAPFGFDASIQQIICLLNGHCLHIIPEKFRRSVVSLTQMLQNIPIHILDCTPSQMSILLRHNLFEKCRELRAVLVGGEEIPPNMWSTLEKIEGVALYNVYGPTECCVDATLAHINDGIPCQPHIGKPIDGNFVFILDENLFPVAKGIEGEIYIAGEGIARGYHNRPEINMTHFLDNIPNCEDYSGLRFYRTGDLGRLNSDGNLIFRGRKDGQIKVRSHRIETMEVLESIKRFIHVADCLVMVLGEQEHKELISYIVPKENKSLAEFHDELIVHLKTLLPAYMLPNRFIEISEIPLTENGKVKYAALPRTDIISGGEECEETEIESVLGDIIEKILKKRIGREESFMAVGGDSLHVMTLLAEVYMRYNVEIDYQAFFQNATIVFLAEEIAKAVLLRS